MASTTTQQDLIDIFYNILREEESDTSAYPVSLVKILLNAAELKICSGLVINPLTKEAISKGQLPFLNTEYYLNNVKSTALTSEVATTDTEIEVGDTTYFEDTGNLFIEGCILTYTGKTATTFTGVTGILYPFANSSQVSVAHAVPTDFMTPINLIYDNRFQIPSIKYDDIFETLNSYKGDIRSNDNIDAQSQYRVGPFYAIKDNAYIILFNMEANDKPIRLRYEKIPTPMTLTTSLTTIDNDIYTQTTIPYLAVGEMLFNRGEEGRAGELLNFALGQVKEMYNYYNKTSYEKLSGKQYGMGKSKLNV